jgi:hypothetical protein
LSRIWNFNDTLNFQRSLLLNHLSDEDVLIRVGIMKLSRTFLLCTFLESVPTGSSIEFSDDRSLRTDLVQRFKPELKLVN